MLGGREGGKSRDSEEQREKGREGQEVKKGGEPGREKEGKRQRGTFQSL